LAKRPGGTRDDAFFIRNSAAIQYGLDPSKAPIEFFWGVRDDGTPASFVPEDGADWFWPIHGLRVGGALVLFYEREQTPSDDASGFESAGWRALVVDDPDDAPSAWTPRETTYPATTFDVDLGSAVMLRDGFVYVYGEKGARHDVYLARFSPDAFAAGDLSDPEWACESGWQHAASAAPADVMPLAAPELSVHFEPRLGKYLSVQTEGYGAATLALRTADAPEGPWSDPQSFLRPPESNEEEAFVYAGKAHPELLGADLVVTYVPSSFVGRPDMEDTLYFPHFVRVSFP